MAIDFIEGRFGEFAEKTACAVKFGIGSDGFHAGQIPIRYPSIASATVVARCTTE